MTGDAAVERLSRRLDRLATRYEHRPKVADVFRDDAAFVLKLRPSLVAERLRAGGGPPPAPEPEPRADNAAAARLLSLAERAEERGGPAARLAPLLRDDAAFVSQVGTHLGSASPLLVAGIALALGFAAGRVLAWLADA